MGSFSFPEPLADGILNIHCIFCLQITICEGKIEKLERDKKAMGDLLVSRREEYEARQDDAQNCIEELSDKVNKLEAENRRLANRLNMSKSEQASLRDQVSVENLPVSK